MNEQDVLRRAALAVVRCADYEASFYEAQSPVEDWALDALQAAVRGDPATASALPRPLRARRLGAAPCLRLLRVERRMSGCCPRCKRPLIEDRHLRYCDRCGYEPPESAVLPVIPPGDEGPDDIELRTAANGPVRASTGKER